MIARHGRGWSGRLRTHAQVISPSENAAKKTVLNEMPNVLGWNTPENDKNEKL